MSGQRKESSPLTRVSGLHLVHDTPKGRAVITSQFIARGTIIEVDPVLVFTFEEASKYTSQTCLEHYTYYWPNPEGGPQTQAIVLGLGSMFNHSLLKQNVTWSRDLDAKTIVYYALKDIEPGEELCISYGNSRLWFKDVDMVQEEEEQATDQDEFSQAGFAKLELIESGRSSSQSQHHA